MTVFLVITMLGVPWALAQYCWGLTRQRFGTIDEFVAIGGAVLGFAWWALATMWLGQGHHL